MSYSGQPTTLIARAGYGNPQPMAGVLDKIGDFLKGAGTGALNYYNQSQQTKGQADLLAAQAAQRSSTPSWLLPAAIVGGGLVLVMLMRRGGPRSNPARRRRRRRSHRARRSGR